MQETRPARRVSLYMRGIMFNPAAETAQVVDTDEMDCTTRTGRRQKRVLEQLLFRREPR